MTYTEVSSVALGGQIVSVSDEFFAEAFHLLLVEVCLVSASQLQKTNYLLASSKLQGPVWA